MIYKIALEHQMVEVQEFSNDNHIHIHIADGYEENGNTKYVSFINLEVSKNECEKLIKCLQYALADYNQTK